MDSNNVFASNVAGETLISQVISNSNTSSQRTIFFHLKGGKKTNKVLVLNSPINLYNNVY